MPRLSPYQWNYNPRWDCAYTDGITEAADMHQAVRDRTPCTVLSQHWAGTAQDIQAAVMADVRCHIVPKSV